MIFSLGVSSIPKETRRKQQKSIKAKVVLRKIPVYFLLLLFGLLFFIPFLWMIMTSLKSNMDVIKQNFWPSEFIFSNYPKSLTTMPFARYTVNTLLITILNMLGTVLSSSLVAYAFARLRWNYTYIYLLATMMIPSQVTQIPLFVLYKNLGWLNTYLPLIVGSFLVAGRLTFFY